MTAALLRPPKPPLVPAPLPPDRPYVATAAEVDALKAQVAALQARVDELEAAGDPLALLSPEDAARLLRRRTVEVSDACRSGELVAEARPHPRGVAYRILRADLEAWYRRTRSTNQ